MSVVESGLEGMGKVRKNIVVLRHRLDFLVDTIAQSTEYEAHWAHDETRALMWALPILEAEWDNLARMHRNVEASEKRQRSLERSGVTDSLNRRSEHEPVWEQPGLVGGSMCVPGCDRYG